MTINITELNVGDRNWWGITTAPNGDMYACTNSSDAQHGPNIYKRLFGSSDFNFLDIPEPPGNGWYGIQSISNGDVYSMVHGYPPPDPCIFKASGSDVFNSVSNTFLYYSAFCVANNGDIYATGQHNDTLQNGVFKLSPSYGYMLLLETSGGSSGIAVTSNSDLYVIDGSTVYKKLNSSSSFNSIGSVISADSVSMCVDSYDNIFICCDGTLYRKNNGSDTVAIINTSSHSFTGLAANGNVLYGCTAWGGSGSQGSIYTITGAIEPPVTTTTTTAGPTTTTTAGPTTTPPPIPYTDTYTDQGMTNFINCAMPGTVFLHDGPFAPGVVSYTNCQTDWTPTEWPAADAPKEDWDKAIVALGISTPPNPSDQQYGQPYNMVDLWGNYVTDIASRNVIGACWNGLNNPYPYNINTPPPGRNFVFFDIALDGLGIGNGSIGNPYRWDDAWDSGNVHNWIDGSNSDVRVVKGTRVTTGNIYIAYNTCSMNLKFLPWDLTVYGPWRIITTGSFYFGGYETLGYELQGCIIKASYITIDGSYFGMSLTNVALIADQIEFVQSPDLSEGPDAYYRNCSFISRGRIHFASAEDGYSNNYVNSIFEFQVETTTTTPPPGILYNHKYVIELKDADLSYLKDKAFSFYVTSGSAYPVDPKVLSLPNTQIDIGTYDGQ